MALSDFSAYRAGVGNHELLNLQYQEKKSLPKRFYIHKKKTMLLTKHVLLLVASMPQEFRFQEFKSYSLSSVVLQ